MLNRLSRETAGSHTEGTHCFPQQYDKTTNDSPGPCSHILEVPSLKNGSSQELHVHVCHLHDVVKQHTRALRLLNTTH